jgi:hypothetical protein
MRGREGDRCAAVVLVERGEARRAEAELAGDDGAIVLVVLIGVQYLDTHGFIEGQLHELVRRECSARECEIIGCAAFERE